MTAIRKFLDKIILAKRYICAILLVIMLAITFSQVIMRYCFNSPFKWADELTLMLLVWFGYLCMSIDILYDSHAHISFLYDKFPPLVKKVADALRHGLLTFFFVAMTHYGYQITMLNINKSQITINLSQAWLYLPLVVGGAFMALYSFINFICVFYTPKATEEVSK